MRRLFVALVLIAAPLSAPAHKDRIFPIKADGSLEGVPDQYGPVKVEVRRAPEDSGKLKSVVLSSPRFRVSLNSCVLDRFKDVSQITASGSWYHQRSTLPPYVSLTFHSGKYDPENWKDKHYSVTYSLIDGRLLMGSSQSPMLFGDGTNGQLIRSAEKCSDWRRI